MQRPPAIAASMLVIALGALAAGCPRSSSADAQREGHDLFAATCARCHGLEGSGGLPLWDGGPSPANFHDHGFQSARSDAQLKKTIVEGKPPGMPAFGPTFNEAQLTALVAHVRSLDSAGK